LEYQAVAPGDPFFPANRMEPPEIQRRTNGLTGLVRSFYFAFAGLAHLFRTQRNARIHLVIGAAAAGLAAWLQISRGEWAVLVLTIAAVIILEGLNTAIEAAVDLASPNPHPLAKIAKDVAAAMVLVAAIASIAVGLIILGPPLLVRIFG